MSTIALFNNAQLMSHSYTVCLKSSENVLPQCFRKLLHLKHEYRCLTEDKRNIRKMSCNCPDLLTVKEKNHIYIKPLVM